jgi:hypothetical protein
MIQGPLPYRSRMLPRDHRGCHRSPHLWWDFGSAAVHHRRYCEWLDPKDCRARRARRARHHSAELRLDAGAFRGDHGASARGRPLETRLRHWSLASTSHAFSSTPIATAAWWPGARLTTAPTSEVGSCHMAWRWLTGATASSTSITRTRPRRLDVCPRPDGSCRHRSRKSAEVRSVGSSR